MVRDTRWQHPPARPTASALRAMDSIAALLAEPPANRSSEDLLAEREQLRVEAENRRCAQGSLRFSGVS